MGESNRSILWIALILLFILFATPLGWMGLYVLSVLAYAASHGGAGPC